MSRRLPLLALTTITALSLAASAANATMFIGLQQDAGPIITVASNTSGSVVFSGAFGEFETLIVSGFGQPVTVLPLQLQSGNTVINNAGSPDAGMLTIYVTSTDNIAPLGALQFTSGFAAVNLSPGWTQTIETYSDPGNGIFALTTLLGSESFAAVGSDTDTAIGDGPLHSVTGVYRITATGLGGAGSSLGVSAVPAIPEPATFLLFGVGLAVVGLASRRRQ